MCEKMHAEEITAGYINMQVESEARSTTAGQPMVCLERKRVYEWGREMEVK